MNTTLRSPIEVSKMHDTFFAKYKMHHEKRQNAKRILFGPVDPEGTKKFIQDQMAMELFVVSQKWNFDFEKEETLDPDGPYIWTPATPNKKPPFSKRKPSPDLFDSAQLYFQPIETPETKHQENADESAKMSTNSTPKQSRITDYMTSKKRASADFQKMKMKASLTERPAKIPKLSDFAS